MDDGAPPKPAPPPPRPLLPFEDPWTDLKTRAVGLESVLATLREVMSLNHIRCVINPHASACMHIPPTPTWHTRPTCLLPGTSTGSATLPACGRATRALVSAWTRQSGEVQAATHPAGACMRHAAKLVRCKHAPPSHTHTLPSPPPRPPTPRFQKYLANLGHLIEQQSKQQQAQEGSGSGRATSMGAAAMAGDAAALSEPPPFEWTSPCAGRAFKFYKLQGLRQEQAMVGGHAGSTASAPPAPAPAPAAPFASTTKGPAPAV